VGKPLAAGLPFIALGTRADCFGQPFAGPRPARRQPPDRDCCLASRPSTALRRGLSLFRRGTALEAAALLRASAGRPIQATERFPRDTAEAVLLEALLDRHVEDQQQPHALSLSLAGKPRCLLA